MSKTKVHEGMIVRAVCLAHIFWQRRILRSDACFKDRPIRARNMITFFYRLRCLNYVHLSYKLLYMFHLRNYSRILIKYGIVSVIRNLSTNLIFSCIDWKLANITCSSGHIYFLINPKWYAVITNLKSFPIIFGRNVDKNNLFRSKLTILVFLCWCHNTT